MNVFENKAVLEKLASDPQLTIWPSVVSLSVSVRG